MHDFPQEIPFYRDKHFSLRSALYLYFYAAADAADAAAADADPPFNRHYHPLLLLLALVE
jgi:hypothetical protein